MTGERELAQVARESAEEKQAEVEKSLSPVSPNLVVTFVDGQGREWFAGGWLGVLSRYENGVEVETVRPESSQEKQFAIRALNVVETDD